MEKKSSNDDDGVKSIFSFNAQSAAEKVNNGGSCKSGCDGRGKCNRGSFYEEIEKYTFSISAIVDDVSLHCVVAATMTIIMSSPQT
jgi:hypothetical protein